jgi:hypothetical protein
MTPRKPRANPATKAEDADKENEDSEDRVIGVEGKGIRVNFPIDRRSGIVLAYAVAFAIVLIAIGFVIQQIIEALHITGGSVQQSMGFVIWSSLTCIFAWLSRSSW